LQSSAEPEHWEQESLGQIKECVLKKGENYAAAEATRLRKSSHGKLRLKGTALGMLIVFLLALWMAYHA
jgi:hypothetical protein